jgi:transaldolase
VFASLEALGISYDDVVQVLEDEGVSKFDVSWSEMLQGIQNELSLKS